MRQQVSLEVDLLVSGKNEQFNFLLYHDTKGSQEG